MQVGLKTWQAFKEHFSQAYMRYQIHKKETAAAHGCGESENHTQEKEAQFNTTDALQALACAAMEYNEAMANLFEQAIKLLTIFLSIYEFSLGEFPGRARIT